MIPLINEVEKPSRVAEFHAFVTQHADVLVESERAPGFKAPFGVLMARCAAAVTEENVELFFAEAYAMLARAAAEAEEVEEVETEEAEEDPVEEEAADEHSDKKSEAEKDAKNDVTEKTEDVPKKLEVADIVGKPVEAPLYEVINPKKVIPAQQQALAKEAPKPVAAPDAKPLIEVKKSTIANRPTKPEINQTKDKPTGLVNETEATELAAESPLVKLAKKEIVAKQISESSASNAAAGQEADQELTLIPSGPIIKPLEIKQEPLVTLTTAVEQKPDITGLNTIAIEMEEQPEPTELSFKPVDIEEVTVPDWPDAIALNAGEEYEIQIPNVQPTYTQAQAEEGLLATTETEQILQYQEPTWETPADLFALRIMELQAAQDLALPIVEPVEPRQPLETPLYQSFVPEAVPEQAIQAEEVETVEQVEQTILLIADSIKQMEAGEAESVQEILDSIVEKVVEIQAATEDSPDIEASLENNEAVQIVLEGEIPAEPEGEMKAELEELFVRLFDQAGIDYTPELIEAFIKVALAGDMQQLAQKTYGIEDDKSLIGKGTHEVIKHFLSAISTIKRAVKNAYQIGKSALNLCGYELKIAQQIQVQRF